MPLVTKTSKGSTLTEAEFEGNFTYLDAKSNKVLQVLQVVKTTVFSTNSTSYVDITGLSINITPSKTNSQILILSTIATGGSSDNTTSNQGGLIRLYRDSTELGKPDSDTLSAIIAFLTHTPGVQTINYLDSPNSTSSLTYKLQTRRRSATGYEFVVINDSMMEWTHYATTGRVGRAISTITAIEIGA